MGTLFKNKYFLFFGTILVLLLINNTTTLWDQDEAAYAGFGKRILDTNNWSIPDFIWSNPHRKTPFHFWCIALSFKLFGISEFSLRIPTVLFAFATFILLFRFIREISNEKQAFLTVLILVTSLLIPAISKIAVTDATLLFFLTVCGISLWYVLQYKAWKYVLYFWIAFSLALLTKGPPVILFSGIFVVLLFIFSKNRLNLLRLHPWFFLPLSLIPFVAWAYSTYQVDQGKFLDFLLNHYILNRINGSVFGQTGYPGTHLLFFLGSFILWIPVFYSGFKRTILGLKEKNTTLIFLFCRFIAGWLIYEISPSKLPSYTLISYIPLAYFLSLGLSNFLEYRQKLAQFLMVFNVSFHVVMWSIGLYILTPLKDVNKRVGTYIVAKASKNTEVFISNRRFEPPSLPFYIEQNGMHVSIEKDMLNMFKRLYCDSSCVLVLSKNQYQLLQKMDSQIRGKYIPTSQILASVTSSYYILTVKNEQPLIIKPVHNSKVEIIAESISQNPILMAEMKKKAIQNDVDIDEQIMQDAKWLFDLDKTKGELKQCFEFQILKNKINLSPSQLENRINYLLEHRFEE